MITGSTELSSSVTVVQYKKLEQRGDRKAIAQFIRERFEERYFLPLESSSKVHGFTILAICCLAIETLESFYQGREDTHRVAKQMFRDFFASHSGPLNVFGGRGDWFFKDIRCGILHQGESRNGWRVWRAGPLLDSESKTINAHSFLCEVRRSVDVYATALEDAGQVDHWILFKKKMKAICDNCG